MLHRWPLTFAGLLWFISLSISNLLFAVSHPLRCHDRTTHCTAGVQGVSVGPLWVSLALEWSSHVALLNGDWTIRTEGQRAAHHGDSGIAQPSLGGPLPWVSGGVAPDHRTVRLWRGGGAGWGGRSWRGRQRGDEGWPRRWGLGNTRADHCGNTSE